jgi:glutaconate CoA-transferase subunit A
MTAPDKRTDLADLVSRIADGTRLAVPADGSGAAMAATRELIATGVRNLHLVAMPTGGLQIDILIGAGCVAVVECAAVSLGEFGLAPRFRRAVEAGAVVVRDATCPAIHAGLLAGEKGVPFMPIRGILGSDLLARRADWRTLDNPFAEGSDPIVLVAAIHPDVLLFHAPLADRYGNVRVGLRRELITAAHAARRTLVTAERIVEENLLQDPDKAPGLLSNLYVEAVAEAPNGAWPLGLDGCYPPDTAALGDYAASAVTDEGFADCVADLLRRDVP